MEKLGLIKNILENELERIKNRIQILEMVESRLVLMRSLAKEATTESLHAEARKSINKRFQNLQNEVNLLSKEEITLC